MNTIAIIPARGGSKGIPNKNIKFFAGKPLIAWTIELAKKIKEINRVIVSTDSEEIGLIASQYGAEWYRRSPELSQDHSLVIDTVVSVIEILMQEGYNVDNFVLLEATAPMRLQEDVLECVQKLEDEDYDSSATFCRSSVNPIRNWKIEKSEVFPFIDNTDPWLPRQELPKTYQLNAYAYASKVNNSFKEAKRFLHGRISSVIIPEERAYMDIDNMIDFDYLEYVFTKTRLK